MKILLGLFLACLNFENQVMGNYDKKSTRFYDLTKEKYFVDKTDFLGEFFSIKENHLYFIACPHRFGKTTYAEMIKSFAHIELEKTHRKDANQTQAYEIFRNLSIEKNKNVMYQHLARHPVISVNLGFDPGRSWESFLTSFRSHIADIFKEFHFLCNSCNNSDVQSFENVFMKKALHSELDQDEILISLKVLIKICNDCFNNRVILLVDHYDSLANHFLHSPTDIDRIYEFINKMLLYALNDRNNPVQYSLIFGVSALMFQFPQQMMYKFTHFPFLGDHKFVKYFGFTKTELKSLTKEYNFKAEDTTKMKVLFEYTSFKGIRLYDPFSVTEYLKSNRNENSINMQTIENQYCRHKDTSGFVSLFMKLMEFRQIVILLLKIPDLSLEINHFHNVSKNAFSMAINPRKYKQKIPTYHMKILLEFFYEHGYLYLSRASGLDGHAIPNLEVDVELRSKLKSHYMKSKNALEMSQLSNILKDILFCPSNATLETKQSLNISLHNLSDKIEKTENDGFSELDWSGLIIADVPNINLWVCNEATEKKLLLLKQKEKQVMEDSIMHGKLSTILKKNV